MISSKIHAFAALLCGFFFTMSCSSNEHATDTTWSVLQDSSDIVGVIEGGLAGPESVRYDPDQDVYFISNFNGDGMAADSNGFITKASPDGTIEVLKFMTGTETNPLHSPRGMYIAGDTLFVADLYGVHGFNRLTGNQLSFTDFSAFEPGFLNDLAQGPDGAIYVTDSGKHLLYRMSGDQVTIAVDSLPSSYNGITFDKAGNLLVLAPWGGADTFHTWDGSALGEMGTSTGGNYDGIEPVAGGFIAASQQDSALHVIMNGKGQALINTPGKPADIGLDTQRRQVAVPYIALNRVDVWQLPAEEIVSANE